MDNASLITTPRGSWILTPTLPMFFRRRNIYATLCLNGHREELHLSRATWHVSNSRHHWQKCSRCAHHYVGGRQVRLRVTQGQLDRGSSPGRKAEHCRMLRL